MSHLNPVRIPSRPDAPAPRRRVVPRNSSRLQLYGWDSRNENWHGPTEPSRLTFPDRKLLQALRAAPGSSWFGPVQCCGAREISGRFFVLVHELSDCAVALIYYDESKVGPAEVLAVLPAGRRAGLREEFAFDFLAFAGFLGAPGAANQLQVYEGLAAALKDRQDATTLAFSIGNALWPGELDSSLCHCVEKVAMTLSQWLDGPHTIKSQSPHAL